jgi:predicted nucleic acid-binding protein
VTHPRIYDPPTPLDHALEQVACWLEMPTLVMLSETARHWPSLQALLEASRITGPQIHDARIAALCRQHGVSELWTADRDFGRFSGLRFKNPLIAGP